MAAFVTWRGICPRCFSNSTFTKLTARKLHSWQPRRVRSMHARPITLPTKFTAAGHCRILAANVTVRFSSGDAASTVTTTSSPTVTSAITDVTDKISPIDPSAVIPSVEAADVVQQVTEVPFSELGLGAMTPVGLIQNALEFLHMDVGLPWWGAIALGTLIARVLIFPIVIKGQRNSAKLNNVMPTMQRLGNKMTEARKSGSQMEIMKASHELQAFMKVHKVNPLKNLIIPVVQAPIFISFFIGLRKMASLPVVSMQSGGMFWFRDLTIADPYFILPALASVTMLAAIELGGETGVQNPQVQNVKTAMRILPFAILPFIYSMPTAVFTYWCTSNFITLCQVGLLKIPEVRAFLGIPKVIKHRPEDVQKSEGLIKTIKSGWQNAQSAYEVEEREKSLARKYQDAGTGPVPQTFYYDPTQARPAGQQMSTQAAKPVRKKAK
ncbi:mitochondrial inner membrane protein OXA1L-like [Ptychodera flava]|uniref:mitochondrial inner membrane protein OXA1L-like n=1 Tax=Ptychodera flava TaxID=63121 RepID=UPI003969D1AE